MIRAHLNLKREGGQILILILISLPVLLVLAFGAVNLGRQLLLHHHLQTHCEHEVLKLASREAEGLSKLSQLNGPAAQVIRARRYVDSLIAASTSTPWTLPPLLKARGTLVKEQRWIQAAQMRLDTQTFDDIEQWRQKMDANRFTELRDHFQNAWRFFLRQSPEFTNETGAPLIPSPVFQEKQRVQDIVHSDDNTMSFACAAKVLWNQGEETWSVHLTVPKGNL